MKQYRAVRLSLAILPYYNLYLWAKDSLGINSKSQKDHRLLQPSVLHILNLLSRTEVPTEIDVLIPWIRNSKVLEMLYSIGKD